MKRMTVDPWHRKHAKMVEFAGWEMPVWYKGIRQEHVNVRDNVGAFDVSHMGEIFFEGKDALNFLQWVTTNDVSKPPAVSGTYSLVLNERGAVKDEALVYKIDDDKYMMVCDAVAVPKLTTYFSSLKRTIDIFGEADLCIVNKTQEMCLFSIQGPKAKNLVWDVFEVDLDKMWWFQARPIKHSGFDIILSKSGYTGENGFELFFEVEKGMEKKAIELWKLLLKKGGKYKICPCGLGARDTLRIEAGYTLYGQETMEKQVLSQDVDEITPLEAGLDFALFFEKDFIGKEALEKQKKEGIKKRLAHFRIFENVIPRHGNKIFKEGRLVGEVTSGTKSPLLNEPIAIGFIENGIEGEVDIEIRKKLRGAEIVKPPFYNPKKYGAFREV
ncbi:MAG: glycine cleavage system aminomethyltransferase GcvT [Candidatus Methanofastidiosia archaeon]